MNSLKGHLLLASSRLLDPNFVRTVVLMVQHGSEGALGVVLNRPLDTPVKQVCEELLSSPCMVDGMLYSGGPCEGPLMVVHTREESADAEVMPGVYFTTEREKIEALMQSDDAPSKYFVGYAGWGAGQLESEMEVGSWLTVPAEAKMVFTDGEPLEGQWSKLVGRVTLSQYIDPDRIPDDPTVN